MIFIRKDEDMLKNYRKKDRDDFYEHDMKLSLKI